MKKKHSLFQSTKGLQNKNKDSLKTSTSFFISFSL